MQMIAGQNVRPNSRPGPIGFGFGSGHNPTAAATMMNRSGPAPTTSKARPTFTHIDLRYWRIAKCGLTVKLRGRTGAPDGAEGAQSLSARGAKPQAHHGPLQRWLDSMPRGLPAVCTGRSRKVYDGNADVVKLRGVKDNARMRVVGNANM